MICRHLKFVSVTLLGLVTLFDPSKAAEQATGSPHIDFARDIRPILSDNCFACHGPDDKARKAKLRLDRKEGVFSQIEGKTVVAPGKSAESELFHRITATDPDDIMPPPKTGKKLTPKQIDLFKRWIDEGAVWHNHWAFETPHRPAIPEVKKKDWVKNPIDNFVLARLESEKLQPNPEAAPIEKVRRATFDLTGLPPSPEEVDAFLADKSAQNYEKVVDRLLESPRYGEHMARYWLDAARYADSHGYHIDSERSIWKWREWVINAFNENLPFDQFTLQQLAGDLLPNPTTPEKVASGYVRCNMSTGEGGAITEEYQAKYTFDRTETTSTIWLGLTMTCARCHTHKYDPLTNREYYQLYAFFNNLDESVMDGNKPNPDPFIKIPSSEQEMRLTWLKTNIPEKQAKLDEAKPDLDVAQINWEKEWRKKIEAGWTVLHPIEMKSTNGSTFRILDDQSILVQGASPEKDVHEVTFTVSAGTIGAIRLEALPHESLLKSGTSRAEDGVFKLSEFEAELAVSADAAQKTRKLKFSRAIADVEQSKSEAGKAIDEKPDTGWSASGDPSEPHAILLVLAEPLKMDGESQLRVRLHYETARTNAVIGHFRVAAATAEDLITLFNPPKLDPWHVLGPLVAQDSPTGFKTVYDPEKTVDLKKSYPGVQEEAKWRARPDFDDGKFHVVVDSLHGFHGVYYFYRQMNFPRAGTIDLKVQADELFKVWVNGQLAGERSTPEKTSEGFLKLVVPVQAGSNTILIKAANQVDESRFYFEKNYNDPNGIPTDIAGLFATARTLNKSQAAKVRNYFRAENSKEWKELSEKIQSWREEQKEIEAAVPTTMVAKESEKRRETFMLTRGEYDRKGDPVSPGVPAILIPFPKDAPTNRLGLARWLVDPSHPLTARVTVNRYWQQYFGVGLVKTVEDFGVQGEPPSHPELLDWLATEFIESGWNIKHLQRLIVTSATYQQSSKASPELRSRDPENRLLARGPRFRLDAEVVRDTVLAIGGLLVEEEGGRSVHPWQPEGLWEAISYNHSQKYVPDKGINEYRRSMYTYWKRQSPPPNMLLFDAPTRETCTVRRPRTNTPLQALALMNDPQMVESCRAFGQRIMLEGGPSLPGRITYAFRLATARKPDKDEIGILANIYNQQLAEYRKQHGAAEKLLKVGDFKAKEGLNHDELAAWTAIANLLINLDETVTKS